MNDRKFCITITTIPHRTFRSRYNNMYWVQIFQETDDLLIQFYAHPNKKFGKFPLDEALQTIEEAKKRLI